MADKKVSGRRGPPMTCADFRAGKTDRLWVKDREAEMERVLNELQALAEIINTTLPGLLADMALIRDQARRQHASSNDVG